MSETLHLTWRQRASWMTHFAKAALRDHHQELEPLFAPLLKPDAVIADVGAHGGQMARLFARLAPNGIVHAFEPTEYARSVLSAALKFRGADHVRIWPYALSDYDSELTIATPIKKSSALGFGLAHVAADGEEGKFRHEKVRAITFDHFAADQQLERLDFIKADIEGWELHFLKGAQATIEKFHPHLFLEVGAGTLARAGDTAEALFDFLTQRGYRAKILTPAHTLEPASAFTIDADYLFSPG